MTAASRDDHMLGGRSLYQGGQHLIQIQIIEGNHIGQLIEQQQIDVRIGQQPFGLLPDLLRGAAIGLPIRCANAAKR